ncbi:hypothetical protein [Thiomicrorhabdus aquaedulcis]|uniref:hypothetical protein n=1 Tax=Thiomicrorhabdus aquaedulcis TaxID=2211106 RepID=UPI000FD91CF1|nr:hypothetical protein [Thiomicrorhabdus aquaedulcis]
MGNGQERKLIQQINFFKTQPVEWRFIVDSPPKISLNENGEGVGVSDLLMLKVGSKVFNGFYFSNGEMGWITDQNRNVAFYELSSVEYQPIRR